MGIVCAYMYSCFCVYTPPPQHTQTCFACVLFAKQNQDNTRVSATSAVCVLGVGVGVDVGRRTETAKQVNTPSRLAEVEGG